VRDKGSLNSAINRPFATFDKQELYPEPVDKAAAILESIVTNHPFIDGNNSLEQSPPGVIDRYIFKNWVTFEKNWQPQLEL
jgi:hypothetical protein